MKKSHLLLGFILAFASSAQTQAQLADNKASPAKGLALGGNGKDPIRIESDKLDVLNKEGKAVFSGNVISVQGESAMRCTVLTVFYEQQKGQQGSLQTAPIDKTTPSQNDSVKSFICNGPVTLTSKTQTATSEKAVFDKASNKVILTGNAVLSDGCNVTQGEKVIYDMTTSVANIETKPGGRVRALFVPESDQKTTDLKSEKPCKKDKS